MQEFLNHFFHQAYNSSLVNESQMIILNLETQKEEDLIFKSLRRKGKKERGRKREKKKKFQS